MTGNLKRTFALKKLSDFPPLFFPFKSVEIVEIQQFQQGYKLIVGGREWTTISSEYKVVHVFITEYK